MTWRHTESKLRHRNSSHEWPEMTPWKVMAHVCGLHPAPPSHPTPKRLVTAAVISAWRHRQVTWPAASSPPSPDTFSRQWRHRGCPQLLMLIVAATSTKVGRRSVFPLERRVLSPFHRCPLCLFHHLTLRASRFLTSQWFGIMLR